MSSTDNIRRFRAAWARRQVVKRPKSGGIYFEEVPVPNHEWDIPAFDLGGVLDTRSRGCLSPDSRAQLAEVGFSGLAQGSACLPCEEFLIGFNGASSDRGKVVRTVLHLDGTRFPVPSYQSFTDERMADGYWLLFPYYCTISGMKKSAYYHETSDVTENEAALVSRDWAKVAILLGMLESVDAEDVARIRNGHRGGMQSDDLG